MDHNLIESTRAEIVPIREGIKIPDLRKTPTYDKILSKANTLKSLSKYDCAFDFDVYKSLELRFENNPIRGGIVFNSPFKLVNAHNTCQQCLYAFEVDTYGRGCLHNCVYCYAKAQLTVHGYWNKPMPVPVDITEIWKVFYTVFETDKKCKWRDVLTKRIPVRIGSMSDSFMLMDKKYKVTQELLKILDYYDYPYIIFTRSDSVGDDEYIDLLRPDLCSIQMSIASTNDELTKKIEPGTPFAKQRLEALQKLSRAGFWTTVRLNPFFPIYPDGYYSDPDFDRSNIPQPFNFSSFEMIDEIASYGIPSVLAGMVRLSAFSINQIEKAVGRDLRCFFKEKKGALFTENKSRDYHLSEKEVRAYYERIQAKCLQNGIQFTTCYIGNGENQFWKDQDLWSNKKDCCNAKGRVNGFVSDSRELKWESRIKHTTNKSVSPNSVENLHKKLDETLSVKKMNVVTDFLNA